MNKIIISTRPVTEDDSLAESLTKKGAKLLEAPLIDIVPSRIDDNIAFVLKNLQDYKWIIFSSRNGVKHFFDMLDQAGISVHSFNRIKFACYGSKTWLETEKYGISPSIKSSAPTSEVFLQELLEAGIDKSSKILLVLGEKASDVLENGLGSGYSVRRINVYKTIEVSYMPDYLLSIIKEGIYDLLLFTSPSAFRCFISIMRNKEIAGGLKIGCIGATTANEVKKHGFLPLMVSTKPDGISFAEEIEHYFNNSHTNLI